MPPQQNVKKEPQSAPSTTQTDVAKPKQQNISQQNNTEPKSVDAVALAITHQGSWEIFDGERIYEKKVEKDETIPGHTILTVRTFHKDTTILNNTKKIDLFDNAESCTKYYNQTFKESQYYNEISAISSKYNDKLKTFMPIIHDKYGNTYEELLIWAFLTKGPKNKQ